MERSWIQLRENKQVGSARLRCSIVSITAPAKHHRNCSVNWKTHFLFAFRLKIQPHVPDVRTRSRVSALIGGSELSQLNVAVSIVLGCWFHFHNLGGIMAQLWKNTVWFHQTAKGSFVCNFFKHPWGLASVTLYKPGPVWVQQRLADGRTQTNTHNVALQNSLTLILTWLISHNYTVCSRKTFLSNLCNKKITVGTHGRLSFGLRGWRQSQGDGQENTELKKIKLVLERDK